MDRAQKLENELLSRQADMIELIEKGDSTVQQFYSGATVFVTGASGFVGKHLIQKLFRACDIKKMYVLMRPKKGKSTQQRLEYIINDSIYDTVRKKKPKFGEKIVAVEGDVADIRIGISDKDWATLTEEVNIIFHVAATIKFMEPLRVATLINVRGTRETLLLAKECRTLKNYIYVSTAYTFATESHINKEFKEEYYPSPIHPDVMIGLATSMDDKTLDDITPNILKDWKNTYTFTKAVAEELVRLHSKELPVCIVRPPFVTGAWLEPTPGWMDMSITSGPNGLLLSGGLGVLHVMLVNKDITVTFAPIDIVTNTLIAAGWHSTQLRDNMESDVFKQPDPIYTISSSGLGMKWKDLTDVCCSDVVRSLTSPKCVWYPFYIETTNNFVFWLLTWLLHFIPAYILDAALALFGVKIKGLPSLTKIYTHIYITCKVCQFFLNHTWIWRDDNLRSLIKDMPKEDRVIFNCDVTSFEVNKLVEAWMIGMRRYIVKDGLQNTEYGCKKLHWLKYANAILLTLYGYFLWIVIRTTFWVTYSIFSLFL